MPRNGSGVYSKPAGTTAVANTTIESSPFNALMDDFAADANLPRPVSAGGTGASNVDDACTNLGAVRSTGGTVSNLTTTGTLTLPAHTGTVSIAAGTGDGATSSTYNTKLTVHYGLGLADNTGVIRGVYNARTGNLDLEGGYKWGGQSLDARYSLAGHTHTYLPLAGGTMTGASVLFSTPNMYITHVDSVTAARRDLFADNGLIGFLKSDLNWACYSDNSGNFVNGNTLYAGGAGGAQYTVNGDVLGTIWGGLLSTWLTNNLALKVTRDGVDQIGLTGDSLNAAYFRRQSDGYVLRMISSVDGTINSAFRGPGYIDFTSDIGSIGVDYFISDGRLKEAMAPSKVDATSDVKALEFIEYDWKPGRDQTGHERLGVLAQNLQSIDPKLVYTLSDGTLGVSEPRLVALLGKALQESIGRIDALEKQVSELRGNLP